MPGARGPVTRAQILHWLARESGPWIPTWRGGGRAARLCGPQPQWRRQQHKIGFGRKDTRQCRLPRRQSGRPIMLRYGRRCASRTRAAV